LPPSSRVALAVRRREDVRWSAAANKYVEVDGVQVHYVERALTTKNSRS
jgi:hypothetical protein